MNCSTSTAPVARFKRGDTFILSGPITVTDGGEALTDLTGFTGRSQLRELKGPLIAELVFSWLDAEQCLCQLSASNTAAWPVGLAEFDIELTSPAGQVMSTRTACIEIVKDITA